MVNRKIKKTKKNVNTLKGKTKLVKAKTKKRVKKGLKKNNREYIKVSENSKSSKFVEMGNKVQKGEVKWSYYSVDGNVGYHYYLKLT
tara:strand:- start:1148 stop:1408 length:261 start_codon:yes stop_codon:yes gene_type:complete